MNWPNFCNVGVVGRIVLAANALVLILGWAVAGNMFWRAETLSMLAALTEPALLTSIMLLCAVRRLAARLPGWGHYGLASTIPLGVTFVWLTLTRPFMLVDPAQHTALVISAALMGVVGLHYFKLRTRALSPAWAEARLQALQARINPHFLFNSLNAAISLVRIDPGKAEQTLENLAELFRAFMRDTGVLHSLDDELQLCHQYAQIEALRLGERLNIEWQIPSPLPDVMLPQLTLQPLLENAVLHGIEPAARGGTIVLAISFSSDYLFVSVANPVVPTPTTSPTISAGQAPRQRLHNRMALDNIRERLRLIYDLGAQLSIQVNTREYIVTLKIPRHLAQDVTHVRRTP